MKDGLAGRGKMEHVFKMAKRLKRESKDIDGIVCMKDGKGNLVMDDEGIRKVWKEYMEKLMNEENDWSGDLRWDVIEGPIQEFSDVEVREELKWAKNDKAGRPTGLVAEML